MKKKILFRADGNLNTGLGHLFRVFALIEMLKDNFECLLLTKQNSTLSVIPANYNTTLISVENSINEEPDWFLENYESNDYIIIYDGYQFDSGYQKKIKEHGYTFVYVDDLASEKMHANVVVNHSLSIKENDFKSSIYTKFALGTQYAILRPKFLNEAKNKRKIEKIEEVFICFGGADFYDLTNKALKGIIEIENIKKIHIVLGGEYNHKNIYKTIGKRTNDIFIYKNLSEEEMVRLMKKCHLAIAPSSTISYEICSVKMLIFGGYYVDNQEKINNGLVENGLIYNAGNFNILSTKDFNINITTILNDSIDNYQQMLDNQKRMFDGKQKKRFIKLIKNIC